MPMMVIGRQSSPLRQQTECNQSKNAILEQIIGICNANLCKNFNDIPTQSN